MNFRKKEVYLRLLSDLLKDLDGICLTVLAKRFKTPKQNMAYYLSALEKEGMIKQHFKGRIKPYLITPEGIKYLAMLQSQSRLSGGSDTLTIPTIESVPKFDNVHNLSFRIEIKDPKPIFLPNEVQLQSWLKSYDWFGDVLLTRYGDKSLEIRFRIECKDPYEAESSAWQKVHRFADQIEKAYGIELGQPIMNRRPHYTHIGDSAVEELSKEAITYVKDVGHIDRSQDTGHIEYYAPEMSKKYIQMPITLERVEKLIQRIGEGFEKVAESVEKLAVALSLPTRPKEQPKPPEEPERRLYG